MKVLYDSAVFTSQAYGGVSRYFYELISHCCNYHDYRPLLIQGFHINEFPFYKIRDKFDFYFSFKYKKIPKTDKISNFLNLKITKYYLSKLNFDIYHSTGYSRAIYEIPRKKKRYKIVLTVHDMIPEYFPEQFSDSKKRLEEKKSAIINSDYIVCVSHSTRHDLQSIYKIPEDKISVVYHGIRMDSENSINYPQIKFNAPYFLYVGSRKQKYKNFFNLLIAFADSGLFYKFNLIAFGGGKFTKNEKSFIKSIGLEKSVFCCQGSEHLLNVYYKNSYAYIYPSVYEGFGMPLLEAMQSGCPILASNVGSIPEIVCNSALTFDPYTVEDIRNKMIKISEDESFRLNLIKQGRERIKSFTWEKAAQQTLEVYKKVMS